MKRKTLTVLLLFFSFVVHAQSSLTSSEIYLGLKKLGVVSSVLYVAAHPDDENTRLLTYLSRERMYRTAYLSITRGDGGQNLIGDEQGVELGLIRTQELLAARKVDGAEQFFTRAYDFGYSKTPEETLSKWNKEKILSDVVWVIRRFRPDVIITRFPVTGEGGHGHHTASAMLANEAFAAAADPSRFPEQLKYVQPWQAKRIAWNSFNFGSATPPEGALSLDVGGYNPILGRSYGEMAADSRSQHKSQGFGVARSRGEAFEYFKTTGGPTPAADLFEDIPTGWSRIKGGEAIAAKITSIIKDFNFQQPKNSVPALVQLYGLIEKLPAGTWREKKLAETQDLLEACSGIWIDAYTSQRNVVHGDTVRFTLSLNNRMGAEAKVIRMRLDGFDTTLEMALQPNRNFNVTKTLRVPTTMPVSQPYWLEEEMEDGSFNVTDQLLRGLPEQRDGYIASVSVALSGREFVFTRPLRYRFTDPVRGELYQPLVVLPAIVVAPDEGVKLSRSSNTFSGELLVTAKRSDIAAAVKEIGIKTNTEVKTFFDPSAMRFSTAGQTIPVKYRVEATRDNDYRFFLQQQGADTALFFYNMHVIRYDHIPDITYFSRAAVKNRLLDIRTPGKRIGYIPGAGDKVPDALEKLGYDVVMLTDKELSRNNLRQFDAIISGVRAYNTNEWLNGHYDKLMNYVKEGGNLIVQYNTSNQIGPVRARMGPYPFTITRTRITDEQSPVVFKEPAHPVLNYPNKISIDDFKGWVQERSIYHASNYDSSFKAVLQLNDPGEGPESGSLIIAKHGNGYFTYTGLALFRQLPAGVPGAYRLLANLVALNHKREF